MSSFLKGTAAALLVVAGFAVPAQADVAARTIAVETLASGNLAEGGAALAAMLAADDGNGEARLGLGMVQFVQALEGLSQGLYKYGLQPPRRSFVLPIVRLPVPVNPNPEPVDYDKFRALLLNFVASLEAVDATLAPIRSADISIPVDIADVRYDADGDGTMETLVEVLSTILDVEMPEPGSDGLTPGGALVVAFDTADAHWFRGYANVLMAMGEFLLAHDWRESFDVSFHVFFPRAQSAFQAALAPPDPDSFLGSETAIADLISFLHIRWPVGEPERMAKVRDHLKTMIETSRLSWVSILAESDNDREWIPGPEQASYIGTLVTAEQVAAWHDVLGELEALLDGEKLMPHWRFEKAVNLRRVFEDPRPFDLVLWITGPAALPYLEDGAVLSSARWRDIIRTFDGQFGSYAIWFN